MEGLTPEQLQAIQDFRSQREASLRREYGWLSLAGLFWLQEGENAFGSATSNPVTLPGRFPAQAGVFTLSGGQVTAQPVPEIQLRLNEQPLAGGSPALKVDTSGQPDLLFLDDLRMMIIERAGQLTVRVWDPQGAVRAGFGGCVWYAPDPKFRVEAEVRRFPQPKQVLIDDIVGIQRPAELHAALAFQIDGQEYSLEAEEDPDGSFGLIFKDSTAGHGTYGAGRYLQTEPATGDRVVIDFNVAYNPPCAFTAYATCPLPRPENTLPVAIEAGEKHAG